MEQIFPLLIVILFIVLLYYLLKRGIKFEIPISKKVIIKRPDIVSPEKKKKIEKISDLQIKLVSEIISRIRKENPDITDDELSRRILFEYEIEKWKHPGLVSTKIEEFKIQTKSRGKTTVEDLIKGLYKR